MIRVISIVSRMNVGGPARLLRDIADGLPEDFHHTLITGRVESNEIDFIDANGLQIEVEYLDSMKRSIFLFDDLRTLVQLVRILRRIRPDIVHTHTSKAGALGRIAAKLALREVKIVHTYHGHLLYGYFSKVKVSALKLFERYLAKFTHALIAVSNPVMNDLRREGVGRTNAWEVIHPGVSERVRITRFSDDTDATGFRALWVGRFAEVKNPILALQAFFEVTVNQGLKAHLTMVGEGELFQEVKARAGAMKLDVEFTGWDSDTEKYFLNCDALLLTSRNEGLPLVILEAASNGVPCVGTNVGGVSDFIDNGKNGFLTEQNATSISESLGMLIRDSRLRKSLGEAAFETFQGGFTTSIFVEKHVTLYRKLIKAP